MPTRAEAVMAHNITNAVIFAIVLMFAGATHAHAQTAFKTGEEKTGTTKQCFYAVAGNRYTRTVQGYELCPLSIQVEQPSRSPNTPEYPKASAPSGSVTAFKAGERTTGQTKQCYYKFGGSEYSKTVAANELCPLSIEVRP